MEEHYQQWTDQECSESIIGLLEQQQMEATDDGMENRAKEIAHLIEWYKRVYRY